MNSLCVPGYTETSDIKKKKIDRIFTMAETETVPVAVKFFAGSLFGRFGKFVCFI